MEVAIIADECAASKKEMTEASEKKENVGSSSNNQNKDYKLLDSTYSAAADGDITKFPKHSQYLDQILTPKGNTILHIHITARPRRIFYQKRTPALEETDFVSNMLEMCPALLRKANEKGETLLHMAARHGHADVAQFLLDECNKNYDQEHGITARAMLQMVNEAKDTALHEAVRCNHLDVVRMLTQADPTLPYEANAVGATPLYLAAERGHEEVLQKILGTCISPADGGPYGRTALHMAVFHKDEGMTKLLLDKEGICNSKQDDQGWTPLHFAAHFGYIGILKNLLRKDKDAAYTADEEGKTALHVAAAGGKVKIMQELLSTCPGCCELVDNRRWNVLHFAVTSEDAGAIRLVLQNPSLRNLVNEKDENGNSPLLQAASMGSISFFQILNARTSTEVDKLVFNHGNLNAADITSADLNSKSSREDITLPSLGEVIFLILSPFFLKRNKISPGMRTRISKTDNIDKSKSQKGKVPTSSKSENGNNVRSAVNSLNKMRETNLLAATLIATVSFAAGLTIPGGFITDKGPHQGTALLSGNEAFKHFVNLNTASFLLSSLAVFFHLFESIFSSNTRKNLVRLLISQYFTTSAMVCMMGAFLSGTWAVLQGPDKDIAIQNSCVIGVLFSTLVTVYIIAP